MKRYLLIATTAILGFLTPGHMANAQHWQLDFGPFAGTGAASDRDKIRHASGLALGVSRDWEVSNRLYVGPKIQLVNGFVSARSEMPNKTAIASFDHRVIAAGISVSRRFNLNQPSLFLAALAGKGATKFDVDESSSNSFAQIQNAAMPVTYRAIEAGTTIPLTSERSSINLSFLGSRYLINQSSATATMAREEKTASGIELTSTTVSAEAQNLQATAVQKIIAIKLGLSMEF